MNPGIIRCNTSQHKQQRRFGAYLLLPLPPIYEDKIDQKGQGKHYYAGLQQKHG